MSRFLALIMLAAMALFLASPAVAQGWDVSKSYTYDKESTVTADKDITVTKEVDISVDGNLDATGGIEVQGDVVFKEVDVEVQDEEVVSKFFELDDSATSRWTISDETDGHGLMSVAEQLQNGFDNVADIIQNGPALPGSEMNVSLQYQVGSLNGALIAQGTPRPDGSTNGGPNNFAKQIQIGEGNIAFGSQQ